MKRDGFPLAPRSDRYHADGGFGTIAVTLVGPSTVLALPGGPYEPPRGTAVLMAGKAAHEELLYPAGYHKPPDLSGKPRRLFIQIVY